MVGTWRVGYVSGVHGACSQQRFCQLGSRRLMYGGQLRRSDIGSRYAFHDGSTPASGTLCLSHGGRKSRCSVDVALLRSLCRPLQCATDSFVGWREDGDYTSIGCWGWGSKGRIPGTSSCLCHYRSYPRVCSISCTGYTLFFYWLGLRESSGVEAIHTWTGDALGRGPYQAVTALNSLR